MTSLVIFVLFFGAMYAGLTITATACEHSIWAALAWCVFTISVTGAVVLRRRKRQVLAGTISKEHI